MDFDPSPVFRDFALLPAITAAPTAHLQVREWAQPSNCVKEYTAKPSECSALQSTVKKCSTDALGDSDKAPVAEPGPFADCFCQQDLLSHIIECQNEHRLCIQDYLYDPEFTKYRDQWNSFCSSASPKLSVTTPAEVQVTLKVNSNTCAYLSTACARYTRYVTDCDSQAQTATFSGAQDACYCQSHVQVVESLCSINGGALCSKENVDLTNLWGYAHCETFLGNIGTWNSQSSRYMRAGGFTATETSLAPLADYPLTYNTIAVETHTNPQEGSSSRLSLSRGILCLSLFLAVGIGIPVSIS